MGFAGNALEGLVQLETYPTRPSMAPVDGRSRRPTTAVLKLNASSTRLHDLCIPTPLRLARDSTTTTSLSGTRFLFVDAAAGGSGRCFGALCDRTFASKDCVLDM